MVEDAPLVRLVNQGSRPAGAARSLAQGVWPAVAALEAACFGAEAPRLPPLFVVGLPRSGTTLVYQALCHCMQVSYIPELAKYAPFAPAFSAWAAHRVRPRYRSSFVSDYGSSLGLASPGEATTWNLWFDKDRFYDEPAELPVRSLRAIAAMVGRIERIGGGPFVNKNLRNNSRIRLLAALFPAATFLVVVRDPQAVATSLLVGRTERGGGLASWFSVKPRDYETFRDARPAVQVARQVGGLLRDLGADVEHVGAQRFAAIDYEDFCRRPQRFVEDLASHLGPAADAFRRVADPPASYAAKSARADKALPFDRAIAAELRDAVAEFAPDGLAENALRCSWLAR